jgi:predicted dienelactone hydrolase
MSWICRAVWLAAVSTILTVSAAPHLKAASAPDEIVSLAGLDVAVWRPTGTAAPQPLVLFSHGFGGCKTQSSFLMRALAERGFLVAAPDHNDNLQCKEFPTRFEDIFLKPWTWSEGTFVERRNQLSALREALQADPTFSLLADASRVVLIGHSLGGYVALGAAGAWPSWQMMELPR